MARAKKRKGQKHGRLWQATFNTIGKRGQKTTSFERRLRFKHSEQKEKGIDREWVLHRPSSGEKDPNAGSQRKKRGW